MNILCIDSSARLAGSDSRELGTKILDKLSKLGETTIHRRDVNNGLHIIDSDFLKAAYEQPKNRSDAQMQKLKISDILVQELINCDALIITLPMYNSNIPASLKMWQDLVMREGETFETNPTGIKGLLQGKKAYIAITTGGVAHTSDEYLLEKLTRLFLNGLGITDQTYIFADNLAYDRKNNLENAHSQINGLKL